MLLLHLSDLHFGQSERNDKHVHRLFNRLERLKYDHIVITGDLTDCGSERQFISLRGLLKERGLLNPKLLTIVPGNHDLFTPVFKHFKSVGDATFLKILRAMPEYFSFSSADYHSALEKLFNHHFRELFGNVMFGFDNRCGYPFIKVINDRVALVVLDSNELLGLRKNLAGSNGAVCLTKAGNILSDERIEGKVKIVCMHHYLNDESVMVSKMDERFAKYMRLKNRRATQRLFKKHDVRLVLHGHWHEMEKYETVEGLTALNAGGSVCDLKCNAIRVDKHGSITSECLALHECE